MTNINDAFPSKFLKADDVKTPRTVTITGIRQEEVGQQRDLKYVAYFQNEAKGLVLNKTVWAQIAYVTGNDDTDYWSGKRIELYTELVRNPQGQQVPGLRVRAPQPPPQPQQQYAPPQAPLQNSGQYNPHDHNTEEGRVNPYTQPQQPQQQQQQQPRPAGNPPNLVYDEPIPDPGDPMRAGQRGKTPF